MSELLRIAAKKSLSRGLVIHNAENNAFRAVIGRKGHSSSRNNKKEERERERREKKEKRREEKREKKERKLKKKQKNVSSSTEESPAKVGNISIMMIEWLLSKHILSVSCLNPSECTIIPQKNDQV